jgi:hypothetical protein
MRTTTGSLCLSILATGAAGFALGRAYAPGSAGDGPGGGRTTHAGLTIERVQSLSSLVTARVDVADVVETTLAGYTGGVRVAILVRGDFLLGTDLTRARFEAVDRLNRTATLVLAAPAVASPRVDHARTRVFAISTSGLWQAVPTDEGRAAVVTRALADAQAIVAAAAVDPAVTARSRAQAEAVLRACFDAAGWAVEIRWGE